MLTPAPLPNHADAADAGPETAAASVRSRCGALTALAASLDWPRIAVLTAVASGHLVGLGLLALPDTAVVPVEPIQRRLADTQDGDRLTLVVDLAPAPEPPLQPLPPTPLRLQAPSIAAPASVPAQPTLVVGTLENREPSPVPVAAPATPKLPPARPIAQAASASVASATPERRGGNQQQIRDDRTAYMRALMAALLQHRSYPAEARKQRARGTVHVRFSVDRDGHVLAASIARGAGHQILEAAALDVLRKADPLPPIPESLGVDRLTVTVPIEYSLITR